jgi:GntR family transcriptional regulator
MTDARPQLVLPPLSAAGPGTLYQQIVDGLTREVSEGRLRPGTALPSFRQLAEDLLVSVITVKRAYEELEREGIIYRRQGLGTFVAKSAPDRSREAKTERARALMRDAIREASEAGLGVRDLLTLFTSILDDERESRHVRKRG